MAERMVGKLTAFDVTRAKKPGMYADGLGLYLQVGSGNARSWIFRYARHGSERYLGLGSASAISLKRARELAADARRLRAEGIDPIERRHSDRLTERVANAKSTTFAQCSAQYLMAHEAGW